MCISQQSQGLATRRRLTESNSDNTIVSTATGHHVRARSYRQPMKPRLPRKLTSSARINLNHYWSILGEFASNDFITHAQSFDDIDLANEINENIANELLEAEDLTTRFVPVSGLENNEGPTFSPQVEESVALKDKSTYSPQKGEGGVTLRLTPSTKASPLSHDNEPVNPEAINASAHKFWHMFLDSSSSKRKTSKSILKIVKKLSKHSD